MCQAGLNAADYKLAIYQLMEHNKLLQNNTVQWAKLADSAHEHDLAHKLQDAGNKVDEAISLLEEAMEVVRKHDHTHPHIHIS